MFSTNELTISTGKTADLSSEDVFANLVQILYVTARMPDISEYELKVNKQTSLELLSELFDRKEFELLDKLTS